MEKFSETVEAASLEDARTKAVSLFGVAGENIEITPVGAQSFFVAVKNLDAEIRYFIPDDNMSVQIQSVREHRGEGRPLTAEVIRETLASSGVTVQISDETIEHIIEKVRAGESLENFVVAEGTPPIHGWDGTVELSFKTEISAGAEDGHSRVDYHERGFVETAQAGDTLGHIIWPTVGRAGADVFGKPVPARSGRKPTFEAGEYVSVDDHGVIKAKRNGMIQNVHGVLSITEMFEHAGDVDFHTGNLHMDEGSLLVRGTIQAGFEVSARGNVIIGKTVREVSVASGGDIELKQGVIESTLRARGAVYARFAQNSTITADGNVVVANNLHNCTVLSGDSVLVKTGKGIVRGGTIICSRMFEAREVGSENEVDTLIELGRKTEEENALHEERTTVTDAIEEINRFLGCEDGAPDLSGKNEMEQQAILKVLETLKELQQRRTEISAMLTQKSRERLESGHHRVLVTKVVYPGTRIVILGRTFLVKSPLSRCLFSYSGEKDRIIVESV